MNDALPITSDGSGIFIVDSVCVRWTGTKDVSAHADSQQGLVENESPFA